MSCISYKNLHFVFTNSSPAASYKNLNKQKLTSFVNKEWYLMRRFFIDTIYLLIVRKLKPRSIDKRHVRPYLLSKLNDFISWPVRSSYITLLLFCTLVPKSIYLTEDSKFKTQCLEYGLCLRRGF